MKLIAHPKYNRWTIKPQRKFTTRPGQLVPFYWEEVVTGDILKIREFLYTQTDAMVAPLEHDLYQKTYYMFVPARLVQSDWQQFRTGNAVGKNGTYGQDPTTGEFTLQPPCTETLYQVPKSPFGWERFIPGSTEYYGRNVVSVVVQSGTWSIDPILFPPQPFQNSLGRYLGITSEHVVTSSAGVFVPDLALENAINLHLLQSIHLVWNEFFRDPDLQDPIPMCGPTDDTLSEANMSSFTDYEYLSQNRLPSVTGPNDIKIRSYSRALYMYALQHIPKPHFVGAQVDETQWPFSHFGDRQQYGRINPVFPLPVNWERDYFIGAKPWQVRGVQPLLPMSTTVSGTGTVNGLTVSDGYLTNMEDFVEASREPFPTVIRKGTSYARAAPSPVEANSSTRGIRVTGSNTNDGFQGDFRNAPLGEGWNSPRLGVTGQTVTGAAQFTTSADVTVALNLAEFELAQRLERFLERMAWTGARYQDWLLSLFGVAPRDESLQRPQFIGGSRTPVFVSKITQTAPAWDTDEGSQIGSVGKLYGRGSGASYGRVGTLRAKEDGFLIAFHVCYPRLEWMPQGIPRSLTRRNRYEYYNPMFDKLPAQGIENRELYCKANTSAADSVALFGYAQRWEELRMYQNQVLGDFRDEYQYWTLARELSAIPSLNGRFIQCDCDRDRLNRSFVYQSTDTFKVMAQLVIKRYRMLSKRGIPNVH